MLEAKHVVKTFDGFRALDGLTMTVPTGAVYGLVGPNGAGKSTIIRHLAGIYRQDSGEVLLDGQPVYEDPAVKRRMTVIGDDWYYFPQANIREMAHFFAGLYPAFSWERYEKLKQVFPLDEKMMLRRMSKGMQKQAAFWLTVCCMPEYLILDEPVDGLDPVMRRQVWSLLLGDVAERGTTVLVSSHNLRELEDVCDHVGVMSRGKLLLEHSLSELQDYTVKLQLAFEGAELPALPQEIKVLHHAQTGRVHTLICRGSAEELEQQLAALRVHGVLFVDVYRHVRVLLQQRPDGGGMVEVTVGQQDILQGTAALRHHALHLRRVVAGVDERADLCRLVAQQVAVGHDGPHL